MAAKRHSSYGIIMMACINLLLNLVLGRPCLFIRITVVEGKVCVIVIGIAVDDLLVRKLCCGNNGRQGKKEQEIYIARSRKIGMLFGS